VAAGIVVGFGIQGYALAMEGLAQKSWSVSVLIKHQ
jgi:3-dehydroquinate dehydratase